MSKYADVKQFNRIASFVEERFIYELPEEVGLSDVMSPHFWRSVSDKIKRLSVVTCIGGKDDLDVDLRCIGSGQGYCVMRMIRSAVNDEGYEELPPSGERHVEYRPALNWCVIDVDGSVIESNHKTREDATASLNAKAE